MVCGICIPIVHTHPRKRVLLVDPSDFPAPTEQHELIIQIRDIFALKDLDHLLEIDGL